MPLRCTPTPTARCTPTEVTTCVEVTCCDGRLLLRTTSGLLRAQRLHGPPGTCRVALVATTALLLGGDHVDLEVRVGAGAHLELLDVAGTVAYAGRGRPATWNTRIELGPGAHLRYAGEPFVVADGAEVTRTLSVDAAGGAAALIRETLILGRQGEHGGWAREQMTVRRAGVELLVEDQRLEPQTRRRPGLLGSHRVVDTLLAVGADPGPPPARLDGAAVRFALVEPGSTLTRFLGHSLADSTVSIPATASGSGEETYSAPPASAFPSACGSAAPALDSDG